MSESSGSFLAGGVYLVLLALMAGGVLVDQYWSRLVVETTGATGLQAVSRAVSDAQLLLALPAVLAGFAALWLSAGRARVLLLCSLLVFSLEVLVPVSVGIMSIPREALAGIGPLLRVLVNLGAITFAFLATRELAR